MFHFTKSFSNFARSYGLQEASGLPDVVPAVFPVSIVDDASRLMPETRPIFSAASIQGATAAVYSVNQIACISTPIQLLAARVYAPGASIVQLRLSRIDSRAANQAVVAATGDARGVAGAPNAIIQIGTATSAFGGWRPYDLASTLYHQGGDGPAWWDGLIMRPGEFFSMNSVTVNIGLGVLWAWRELWYPLPPNPPSLL